MAEIKKYLDNVALGTLVDQIKAEDVKVLEAAKKYTDDAGKLYDGAGSAATAESNAKAYTDELANGQVKLNKEAIEKLNGTGEGSVAKAVADAKALVDADVDAVEAIANKNKTDIEAINHAETGILKTAKDYADGKAAEVQGNVDAVAEDLADLAEYVGTIPEGATATDIVGYVTEKTSGIASEGAMIELGNRVTQAEKDIDAIEADYLKAADKTELEGKITATQGEVDALEQTHATDKAALEAAIALKADQTALDAVSGVANAAVKQADYDVKVKALEDEDARIVGLVESEAALAREEEGKLNARLVEVETFFKTAEGETLDEALDTLVELQTYLTGEGAAADQMVKDIAANKKAIEDHVATDHDFAAADVTLKSELEGKIDLKADKTTVEGIDGRLTTAEGKITAAEGKITTLEGEMDAVEAAVATKAEEQALTNAVAALEGADAAQVERIAALEEKFNGEEGSVADMIADAKQEAIDAAAGDATEKANKALEDAKKYADEEDAKIEGTIANLQSVVDSKAAQADLTALEGRVTTAEGEIDTLQGEMDAVEALAAANKAAHEANAAAILLKASQADLEAAVARVAKNETDIAGINTTLGEKADADDLDAAIERIAKNESDIAANTSAINSFTPVTSEEILAMFA